MKILTTVFLACFAVTLFSGCAFMSPEDRDFYGKGWVRPSELDPDNNSSRRTYDDANDLGTTAHVGKRNSETYPSGY